MKRSFLSPLTATVLILAFGSLGQAAIVTWTGPSGGDWGTGTDWSSTPNPPASIDTAVFNTNISSVTNTSNHSITNISFDTSAGSITVGSTSGGQIDAVTGGTIQLLGTMTGQGLTETINAPVVIGSGSAATIYTFANNAPVSSGDVLNFGGAISGGTTGTVTLTLGGTNTGPINTISGKISNGAAGALYFTISGTSTWLLNADNSGITGTGTITVTDGTTAFSGPTLLIGSNTALGSDAVFFGGASGAGTANFGAVGTVTVANSFFGGTTSPAAYVGSGNLTINGSFNNAIVTNTGIYNLATGSLTFGSVVNLTAAASGSPVFQLRGPGNTTFNSTSSINNSSAVGSTASTKFLDYGSGTLTIAGSYNATNIFADFGGTLVLDTSSTGTRLPNAGLILGGTTLDLSGGTTTSNQTVTGTTIRPGQTTIQDTHSGTAMINLGALTGSTGGLVNFGSGAATTSTANGASGIMGATYTFGGIDWAVGSGTTTAVTGYTADTPYSAVTNSSMNYLLTGNGSIGTATSIQQNALKINSSGSGQSFALASGAVYTSTGILYVGSDNYSITGGTLNTTQSQLVIQQWGVGSLTIGSAIADRFNTVEALVKGGGGTLVLSGANAYTGLTYIDDGTVSISSDGNLGGQNSVAVATSSTSSNSVTLVASAADLVVGSSFLGSTVQTVSGTSVTLAGNANQNISSSTTVGFITSPTNLTLVLNGGTLSANGTFSLAETLGAQTVSRSISLGANGGTLDVTSGNTLTVPGVITNLIDATLGFNTNPIAALTKTGSGTLVLSALNTYSGGTNINGGVLNLGIAQGSTSGPLGTSANSVPTPSNLISFGGGTLQYSSVNQTDYSSALSTAPNQAYSIDTNGEPVTFASPLTSSGGSLTKIGTGTLTLSAMNTYNGPTTIQGGTLKLATSSNNNIATSNIVVGDTVANNSAVLDISSVSGSGGFKIGKSLSGTGTIATAGTVGVNMQSASVLAPGSSQSVPFLGTPGTLANGNLTLSSTGFTGGSPGTGTVGGGASPFVGSLGANTALLSINSVNLTFALGASGTSSALVIGGAAANTLTFTGTSVVTINDLVGAQLNLNTEYVLIQGNGSTIFNTGAGSSLDVSSTLTPGLGYQILGGLSLLAPTNGNFYSQWYGSSELYLNGDNIDVDVVPEPSTWAMMIGGFVLLVAWQRRKNKLS